MQKVLELNGIAYGRRSIADTSIYHRPYHLRKLLRSASNHKQAVDVGLFRNTMVSKRFLKRTFSLCEGKYLTGHAAYTSEIREVTDSLNAIPILVVRHPAAIVLSHVTYFQKRPDIFYGAPLMKLDLNKRIEFLLDGSEKLNIFPLKAVFSRYVAWEKYFPDNIFRFEDLVGSQGGGSLTQQRHALARLERVLGKKLDIRNTSEKLFGGTHTFSSGRIDRYKDFSEIGTNIDRIMADSESYRTTFGYCCE